MFMNRDFGNKISRITNPFSQMAETDPGTVVAPPFTGKGYTNSGALNAVSAYAGVANSVGGIINSMFQYNSDSSGALTAEESKLRQKQNASAAGNTVASVIGTVMSILGILAL